MAVGNESFNRRYWDIGNQSYIAIWNLIFLSIVIYKSCIKKRFSKLEHSKRMLIIAMIIFTGQFIGFSVNAIRLIIYGKSKWTLIESIMVGITILFNAISSLLMYLYMAFSLHLVFKNTMYKINKFIINIHIINFTLIVLLCIIMGLLSFLDYNVLLPLIIFILLCSIGAIHMTYLFNKKLYLMILSQRTKKQSITKHYHHTIDIQRELIVLNINY